MAIPSGIGGFTTAQPRRSQEGPWLEREVLPGEVLPGEVGGMTKARCEGTMRRHDAKARWRKRFLAWGEMIILLI